MGTPQASVMGRVGSARAAFPIHTEPRWNQYVIAGEEQPQTAGLPRGFYKEIIPFIEAAFISAQGSHFSGVSMGKRTCQLTGFYCTFHHLMETDFCFLPPFAFMNIITIVCIAAVFTAQAGSGMHLLYSMQTVKKPDSDTGILRFIIVVFRLHPNIRV